MTAYRYLPDGSILFPNRGKPPAMIPGFERDKGDPFHFIPEFEPCKHRTLLTERTACGKTRCNWQCQLKHKPVNIMICEDCFEEKD